MDSHLAIPEPVKSHLVSILRLLTFLIVIVCLSIVVWLVRGLLFTLLNIATSIAVVASILYVGFILYQREEPQQEGASAPTFGAPIAVLAISLFFHFGGAGLSKAFGPGNVENQSTTTETSLSSATDQPTIPARRTAEAATTIDSDNARFIEAANHDTETLLQVLMNKIPDKDFTDKERVIALNQIVDQDLLHELSSGQVIRQTEDKEITYHVGKAFANWAAKRCEGEMVDLNSVFSFSPPDKEDRDDWKVDPERLFTQLIRTVQQHDQNGYYLKMIDDLQSGVLTWNNKEWDALYIVCQEIPEPVGLWLADLCDGIPNYQVVLMVGNFPIGVYNEEDRGYVKRQFIFYTREHLCYFGNTVRDAQENGTQAEVSDAVQELIHGGFGLADHWDEKIRRGAKDPYRRWQDIEYGGDWNFVPDHRFKELLYSVR